MYVGVVVAVDDVDLIHLDITCILGLHARHRVTMFHDKKKLGERNLPVFVDIHLFDQMLCRLNLNKSFWRKSREDLLS